MRDPDERQWELNAIHSETQAFIQWKGTDVCMDFRCECGGGGHVDAMFAYAVRCNDCGTVWEMPSVVFLRKAESSDVLFVTPDADGEDA